MSVDMRTRVDRADTPVEAGEFFESTLPAGFAAAADRLRPSLAERRRPPLTIEVGAQRWTLAVADDQSAVTVTPAGGAGTVLRVNAERLARLVADQVTPMGWLASGDLDIDGELSDVLDWWVLLRAVLDGTTPHTAGAITLRAGGGGPLDLSRTFTADDPADELTWFLEQTGYLRIGGVFSNDEMAEISAEMDRAAPGYTEGDARSWWARLDDGRNALVRMQEFQEESAAARAILTDERLARLGSLTGDGHRPGSRGLEALFKPLGVVQGISDIPWHKDCSLGRHSYDCCAMTVGISVTGADARSGQLRVVAGSHRALVWPAPCLQPGLDLPVVNLPTETGDITVHLSCTLHMAQPPVERERRVLYTALPLPATDTGALRAGRDRLRAVREAAPLNTSQPTA